MATTRAVRFGTRAIPRDFDLTGIRRTGDTLSVLGPRPVPADQIDVLITYGPHAVRGPVLIVQIGGIPGQALDGYVVEPVEVDGPTYYAPGLAAELMNLSHPDLVFEVAGRHKVLPMSIRLSHQVALMATSTAGYIGIAATRRDEGGWAYWLTDAIPDPKPWVAAIVNHHRWLMEQRPGWYIDIPMGN